MIEELGEGNTSFQRGGEKVTVDPSRKKINRLVQPWTLKDGRYVKNILFVGAHLVMYNQLLQTKKNNFSSDDGESTAFFRKLVNTVEKNRIFFREI